MLIHEFLVQHVHIHHCFLFICHLLHLLITYMLPILTSFNMAYSLISTVVQFSLEASLLFKLLPLNFTIMKLFFILFIFIDLLRLQHSFIQVFVSLFTLEFGPNHFPRRLSEAFASQDGDKARSSKKQPPSKIEKRQLPQLQSNTANLHVLVHLPQIFQIRYQ